MSEQTVELTVNGEVRRVQAGSKTTLLEVLRDQLHLTGTKNGCGQGHCGSCTVLVDGKATRSCVYRALRAVGKRIETIEGLSSATGELHPLQAAFIRHGAVQCGFCTPGMIMSAKALLDSNPHPDREEIIAAIEPNLCRCTGYTTIVAAIESVANARVSVPTLDDPNPSASVGRSVPRPDAVAKVTGAATYTDDLFFDGLLYAAVRRSDYAHARLLSVHSERARSVAGVVAVLTADDVPGSRNHGLIQEDWPVLAYDKVRYIGDAIAVVVAESQAIARQAADLVTADYEPLPVVSSPQEARDPAAPRIHDGGNLLEHIQVRKGDVRRGFAESDVIIEREYHTARTDHAFLEPEACVTRLDHNGDLLVHVGSQIPFADRRQIAASLAIPESRVRVIQPTVGGGFGGKEDIAAQIHSALATWITRRPVKLVYTRQESIRAHPKRHATTIRLKTGARRDGRLMAVQAEILGDTGAYASLGSAVMTRTTTHAAGPYEVPNVECDCFAMYTNNIPAGAFRGFGVTQACFAVESQMDILAAELGIPPLELRRINALRTGSATSTGQVLGEGVGLLETIAATEHELGALGPDSSPQGDIRRAWGIACAYKNVGLGGGLADSAGAQVEITLSGQAIVRAGAAEIGQGLVTVLAQIASEELGIAVRDVRVIVADTGCTPDGGATTASRQTFITGNAVRLAASRLRSVLSTVCAEELDTAPNTLVFTDGLVRAPDGKSIAFEQASQLAHREGKETRVTVHYTPPKTAPLGQPGDMHFAFGYATQAAQVEVNIRTGEVKVLRIIAAHDVGRAINPLAVRGQIEGGVVMGMGHALMEEIVMQEGKLQTTNLRSYRLPRSVDMPEIIPVIVEAPAPEGPYGAKGVGEIPSIPTSPAIANAIYNACGARVYSVPATKDQVLAALKHSESA